MRHERDREVRRQTIRRHFSRRLRVQRQVGSRMGAVAQVVSIDHVVGVSYGVVGADAVGFAGVNLVREGIGHEELRRERGGLYAVEQVADFEVDVGRPPVVPAGEYGLKARLSAPVRHLIATQPMLPARVFQVQSLRFVGVRARRIDMPHIDLRVRQGHERRRVLPARVQGQVQPERDRARDRRAGTACPQDRFAADASFT